MNILKLNTEKSLVGIEIRTSNSIEYSNNGKIPKLWETFFKDEITRKIKNKTSENIHGIYSNYESDHTGEYDYFIGFEIQDVTPYLNNKTLIIKKIDKGSYSVITTEKGFAQSVISAAWEKIWKMNPIELGGKRLFKTDFEIYTQNTSSPNEEIFHIYLGIQTE
ncbi:GyrI-like domain-containing protein [Fluviispira multicolorata]|uniref:AraC effector-binding domain-containing protein n=1 Tax=Fluviispira multicolorata TaxID=2654512 RepID=A0A833N099_9BACT|nr:effector binding domain-containing protein [Fluviispira multicolorata]KAB8028118.1 hypothetical protein GCL57_13790 [Fluviispira multicolorata]